MSSLQEGQQQEARLKSWLEVKQKLTAHQNSSMVFWWFKQANTTSKNVLCVHMCTCTYGCMCAHACVWTSALRHFPPCINCREQSIKHFNWQAIAFLACYRNKPANSLLLDALSVRQAWLRCSELSQEQQRFTLSQAQCSLKPCCIWVTFRVGPPGATVFREPSLRTLSCLRRKRAQWISNWCM